MIRLGALTRSRLFLLGMLTLAAGAALPWASAEPPQLASDGAAGAEKNSDEVLPVGRNCTVVLTTAEGQTEIEGVLHQVNDRWLVLHHHREGRSEGLPMLSKIPYTSRLFKNVGVGRVYEDIWIPRDRVLMVRASGDHLERIGVDFDFEVDSLRPSTFIIPRTSLIGADLDFKIDSDDQPMPGAIPE